MSRFVFAFVIVLGTMLLMEAVWFSVVVDRVYRPELGALLADEVRPVPAIVFYLLYPVAVVILAVRPLDERGTPVFAWGRGVVLGLAAYGAYELTNLATLTGWSEIVTLIDLAWGAVLTSTAALLSSALLMRIFATRTD